MDGTCTGVCAGVEAEEGFQGAPLLERVPPGHRLCDYHSHHPQHLRGVCAAVAGTQVEGGLRGSVNRVGRHFTGDGGADVDCVVSATIAQGQGAQGR